MYDSPKAAHFTAHCNGSEMRVTDPCGLSLRWSVANRLSGLDMLHLSQRDRREIQAVLDDINQALLPRKITLSLKVSDHVQ